MNVCDEIESNFLNKGSNLIGNELNDERQKFQVRFHSRFLWREENNCCEAIKEDEETNQMRPYVDSLIVNSK